MEIERGSLAWIVAALLIAAPLLPRLARGQIAENPEDPFGIAIPHARVRLVHSEDPGAEGGTAHLRARRPFLFYQLGRELTLRQYEPEHGILGRPGEPNVPLYVGFADGAPRHGAPPARFARDHAASCGMCHASVYREPAAGQTIGSTGGLGRNSTHFFGSGLVEMIGERIWRGVLNRYDANGNSLIDRDEIRDPSPVRIRPTPESEPLDFGDLSPGPDGVPRLNTAFRLWYVDADGRVLPDAVSLDDERVAAFGLAMQPFGWGRGRVEVNGKRVSQGGEATTIREFAGVAFDVHMGLQVHDPTQHGPDPEVIELGGLAQVSLSGAQQFEFGGSVDRGRTVAPTGLSLDDPDGDGVYAELTEGDMDAIEFFLLNTPPPAVRGTPESEKGRQVLHRTGCTRCHVETWQVPARDDAKGFTGDRRFFHLEVKSELDEQGVPQLVGEVRRLYEVSSSGERVALRGEALVERIYSDFRHWDVGPAYHERRWDGTLQREHRTAFLWGADSSAPYGHAGQFMTLHDAIAAHGGAAGAEREAYMALDRADRERLLEYLRSLVLYSTEDIPSDVDGDGSVSEAFEVEGRNVGYERFNPLFLFENRPVYKVLGMYTHPTGRRAAAGLIENVDDVYGLNLEYRRDKDGDGYPDVLDPAPARVGIRPGAGQEGARSGEAGESRSTPVQEGGGER